MITVQRAINPAGFTAIPRIRDLINNLHQDVRVCVQHDEPVVIRESEFLLNQHSAAPFAKAAVFACCDAAIDKVIFAVETQTVRK
jgi:hypothetical protein